MSIQTPTQDMPGSVPWFIGYPTEAVSKALVGSMELPAEPTRRGVPALALAHLESRWPIGIFLLIGLASLTSLWFSNSDIDWEVYWIFAIMTLLLQIIVLALIWYAARQERRAPGGILAPGHLSIRTLRRAALAGDDSIAPPIALVPEGQQSATSSFKLRPPETRFLRGQQIMFGLGLIFFVLIAAFWAGLLVLARMWSGPPFPPWQMLGLYALLIIIYMLRFVGITRRLRVIPVEARADGLHWRGQTLPWSEVRGWCVFAMNPVGTGTPPRNIVYALVGERASLTWLTYPPFAHPEDPGQQLARLVQANVTLPLRDLTPGALRVNAADPGPFSLRRALVLAIGDGYLGELRLLGLPVVMLTSVLALLILLGGILTPTAQQWYFGGQLTRLETAPAQISDPLTANTLQWTPTSADAAADFAFTPQGYVSQSTNCCNLSSLIAQPMNNGLIEITMRRHATFDLDDAGILFRTNAESNTALAFTITPNGQWHLKRFPLRGDGEMSDYGSLRYEGIFGGIAAIHQGLDATNRLAVLMNGSSYTFFVNGQFVGNYIGNDLPQSGQVGVIAGSDGPTTFSDLLLSPA